MTGSIPRSVVCFALLYSALHLIIHAVAEVEGDQVEVGLPVTPHEADALTPEERCEACQIVLRTVYGHFGRQVPSRRKLAHQLRHECNRHYQYRKKCILFTRLNTETIFREMANADFKPIKPCTLLKECKRLQSPIVEGAEFPSENATLQPTSPPAPPADTTPAVTLAK
ncbi:unnamed protein product, partial [Mesorhabditis spiculigera]